MRRKDREVTDAAALRAIVQACDCCRLGLVDEDGVACIVPLNFGYTEEDGQPVLYFHSAREGHKLTLLRKNPVVGFEMDTGHGLLPGTGRGTIPLPTAAWWAGARWTFSRSPRPSGRG